MDQIPSTEVKKKKLVGKDGTDSVYEVSTVGGLHLILADRKKGVETLGMGSHRAVARWIATKKAKGIVWNELSKSEAGFDPRAVPELIAQYERLTDAVRAKRGD